MYLQSKLFLFSSVQTLSNENVSKLDYTTLRGGIITE